jgi:hypothetical protein
VRVRSVKKEKENENAQHESVPLTSAYTQGASHAPTEHHRV